MRLSKPVKLIKNGSIQQICLPNSKLTATDIENCYVTGWGRDKDSGLSARLLQTKIPIHDHIR